MIHQPYQDHWLRDVVAEVAGGEAQAYLAVASTLAVWALYNHPRVGMLWRIPAAIIIALFALACFLLDDTLTICKRLLRRLRHGA